MRLINHPSLGQMQFVPENVGEISALKQLPAFLDKHQPSNDFSKFSSNKFPVVRNILSRLPREMLKNVDTKWITGTKKLQEIPDTFFRIINRIPVTNHSSFACYQFSDTVIALL
jgi:hypothetical protein